MSKIKQHIIETASILFYKNGYNSTGINEIIAEAGIAKATLYNHFKSKEDICLAYLRHKDANYLKDLSAYCGVMPKGKQQILAIFDFLELFFKKEEFAGCWCVKTLAEVPKENIRIVNEIQTQKNNFISFISDLISSNLNIYSESDLKIMSRQIYLLYESAVTESHLHQKKWPILEAKSICDKIST